MYIPKYPSLSLSLLLKRPNSKLGGPIEDNRYLLFSSGRDAIKHSIKIMGLSDKDNVLIPSYICYSAVEPFLRAKIRVIYFSVNKSLGIDLEDLFSKIDPYTKAILIVRYFGFTESIEKIVDICKRKKIYLIEDCAHTFCQRNEKTVRISGDLSIYSLRKIFPIPDGGALVVNNSDLHSKAKPIIKIRHFRIYISLINLLLSRVELKTGLCVDFLRKLWKVLKELIALSLIHENPSKSFPEKTISDSSRRILKNINYPQVIFRRRRNFEFLLQKIFSTHEELLFYKYLPEGICPLAFPILLKDRNRIHKEMLKRGFGVYPWPFLPEAISRKDFPNTFYLADHLLLLPIHQDIEKNHLKKMCGCLFSLL